MKNVYHRLTVQARDPDTTVTVTDEDGHLISTGPGIVNVSLMPGLYLYWYGKDGRRRPLLLDDDINVEQAAVHARPYERSAVDGRAYVSPSRPCCNEECPGRMQWQLGDTWYDREFFLCVDCGERENVKDNETILLRETILESRKIKDERDGR